MCILDILANMALGLQSNDAANGSKSNCSRCPSTGYATLSTAEFHIQGANAILVHGKYVSWSNFKIHNENFSGVGLSFRRKSYMLTSIFGLYCTLIRHSDGVCVSYKHHLPQGAMVYGSIFIR